MSQQQDEKQQQSPVDFTPGQYDQVFSQIASQVGQVGSASADVWQALYFDQAEQNLRVARRATEILALSQMRHQIAQEVTSQVIATIKQNPQLLQSR